MKVTKSYLRSLIKESLEEVHNMPVENEGMVYVVFDIRSDTVVFASLNQKTALRAAGAEGSSKIRILRLKLGAPIFQSIEKLPGVDEDIYGLSK